MAKNVEKCKECGGPKKGRGFAHVRGCKKASPGAKANKVDPGKPDIGRMSVAELMKLRQEIDEAIKSKKPEIEAQIRDLRKTLQDIG